MADNAAVVSISGVPSTIAAGTAFTAVITMQNTGDTTWVPGTSPTPGQAGSGYKLGAQDPQDNTNWGAARALLPPGNVAPGGQVAITIHATAPAGGGSYAFDWQMVLEGVAWFGAKALGGTVVVTTPPPVPMPLSSVLSAPRPSPTDPSSGTIEVSGRTPAIWNSGVYIADYAWRTAQLVNDTGRTLQIVKSYLWTGIDIGGQCDTHVQAVVIDTAGGRRMLDVMQWDHYAQPTSFQGRFNYHNPPVLLLPNEVLELGWFSSPMGGLHAQHIMNMWVLYV